MKTNPDGTPNEYLDLIRFLEELPRDTETGRIENQQALTEIRKELRRIRELKAHGEIRRLFSPVPDNGPDEDLLPEVATWNALHRELVEAAILELQKWEADFATLISSDSERQNEQTQERIQWLGKTVDFYRWTDGLERLNLIPPRMRARLARFFLDAKGKPMAEDGSPHTSKANMVLPADQEALLISLKPDKS